MEAIGIKGLCQNQRCCNKYFNTNSHDSFHYQFVLTFRVLSIVTKFSCSVMTLYKCYQSYHQHVLNYISDKCIDCNLQYSHKCMYKSEFGFFYKFRVSVFRVFDRRNSCLYFVYRISIVFENCLSCFFHVSCFLSYLLTWK